MLHEQMSPKFWWLDPNAVLHRVPANGHWDWAMIYLTKREHYDKSEIEKNVYGHMLKLGWSRVALFSYGSSGITLEYDYNKFQPLTQRQMKEIKDLAIEEGATETVAHPYEPARETPLKHE